MSPGKHKRAQEMAEREKRERLAYVGTLAAGLVHEMRTPLNAIQLNAQLLEEDVAELPEGRRERFRKRAKRINTELKEVVRTLEEFLAFARPPRLDPAPTDLNHFLRELLEFAEPEFDDADIHLETRLAEDMYPVVLDKAQFTHVMLNLLRNAREACEARLAQEARGEAPEGAASAGAPPTVTVATDELEGEIEILVDDNGVGIGPGREEEIFELFHTTKEKGTGLGLGIVRRIVEEHGGRIAAGDRPGGGARFRVVLPRGKFLEFKEA